LHLQLESAEDKRPDETLSSIGYHKVPLDTRGRFRVVAGAEGDEGFWGDLISTDESDKWMSRELLRVPMRDAIFLSDTEIIACDRELYPQDEKTGTSRPPEGIILHSLDGGKSWTPLYRSKLNETFIYITKAEDRQFYAISNAGTSLRFNLKK
jgi:hypothetical protein